MTDLSSQIITKIKTAKIHPHSKLHFQLITWGLWGLLVLLIVVSAFSFGLSLHQFEMADWDLRPQLAHSLSEFLLFTIPWFWLILILVLTIVTIHFFRRTKQGHKITPTLIVSGIIFLSLLGGGVIHATHLSEKTEKFLDRAIPPLQKVQHLHQQLWQNPEAGFLGGHIIEIPGAGHLVLEGMDGEIWSVDFTDFPDPEFQLDQMIRVRGEVTDDFSFFASEFRGLPCSSSDHQNCQMQPKPFQRLKEFFHPARNPK